MALINCPECGKEISDKSKLCVHCGYPINESTNEKEFKYETKFLFQGRFDAANCFDITNCQRIC